jgi:cytochrome c2
VVELEPSDRFPYAPAPKVVHGYELIRKYGCFGCHEINGFDGPNRRVGPDLRLEPNYFAAGEILADLLTRRQQELEKQLAPLKEAAAPERKQLGKLVGQRTQLEADLAKLQEATGDKAPADKDQQVEQLNAKIETAKTAEAEANKKLEPSAGEIAELESGIARVAKLKNEANELVAHPELNDLRTRIRSTLEEDALQDKAPEGPLLSEEIHQIAGLLKDVETPGVLRKVGPSLRHVASKLDRTFMYDWINDPKNFRPNTRMPRFFGQWNHFPKNEKGEHFDERAARFEPIETRGAMEYLLKNSQPFAFVSAPQGAEKQAKDEQIARGKMQFETRGCLACHTHKDFPDTSKYRNPEDIVQGPDLSSVGTKFSADQGNKHGPEWLYSWLKNPSSYNPRTLMPDLFLDVAAAADGKQFDPADDIKEYLLSSTDEQWKPVAESTHGLDAAGRSALHDLTLDYLREAFYSDDAERYVKEGIAPELRAELKGAEQDLIRQPGQKGLTEDQMLLYIGRKTITKYGCYGCHDIPGFEDAKPIGTGLADWGRKDPSKLAFEHITHYLEHHGHAEGGHAEGGHAEGGHAHEQAVADERQVADEVASEEQAVAEHEREADAHDNRTATELGQDEAFYHHAIEAGNRIGFINQKLKEPRSYDFEKTANKRYNERLRMPQFSFTDAEREAIMTFVLGLVADPPRENYIFTPDPRKQALIQGQVVLEKYNCRGCHILETQRWNISYAPGSFGPQQKANIFPFLITHFGPKELAAEGTPNRRNQLLGTLRGLPTLLKNDGLPYVADEEGVALEPEEPYDPAKVSFALDLYQPTILDGQPYLTGQSSVLVQRGKLDSRYPTSGGLLTSYLLPRVTQLERQVNSNASGAEAYGWLPPPLIGEGTKVQAAWLHDFLLDPYPIRPAVFLRMPKFNMSADEASQLVDYFAARDNATFPYEFSQARQESHLQKRAESYEQRLKDLGVEGDAESRFDAAMKIVVDNNYCVKCHQVADFIPQGGPRARAPNLADVYRRLRPEYVRHWIANPKMILPYTSMPVNIPYDPAAPFNGGVKQELYHGTSTEQVDALVDLLMNFDRYAKQNTTIADKVQKPAETPPAAAAIPNTNTQTSND